MSDTGKTTDKSSDASQESEEKTPTAVPMISRSGRVKSTAIKLWPGAPDRPEEKEFGDHGQELAIKCNNYRMDFVVPYIHMYDVTYSPDLPTDARRQRRRVVLDHLERTISEVYGTFFYDNTRIWSLKHVADPHDFQDMIAKGPDGKDQFVHIRFLKKVVLKDVPLEEREMIYHIVLQKTLRDTKMVRVGRSYHDKEDDNHLQDSVQGIAGYPDIRLWRGYQISMEPTIEGLQLKADVNHRIIHIRSVREMMNEQEKEVSAAFEGRSKGRIAREIKERCLAELQGGAVITLYNMRVWRIHDIDYDISILDGFVQDTGEKITFQQYFFDRYGQKVSNTKKGMLIHNPKKKGSNPDRTVVLAPELCFMTGLTKKMKANYRYMRAVSEKTRLGASRRHNLGQKMVERLADVVVESNIAHVAEKKNMDPTDVDLNDCEPWELAQPLAIDTNDAPFLARTLPGVKCLLSKNSKPFTTDSLRGLNREWGRCGFAPDIKMHKLKEWAVLCEEPYKNEAMQLLITMRQLCTDAGLWGTWIDEDPYQEIVPDFQKKGQKHTEVWQKKIKKICKKEHPDIQMVICILPDRGNIVTAIYSHIKEATACDHGILSQCIKAKSMKDDKRRSAIVRNLIKQIMTKMGNVPWKVEWSLPDKSVKIESKTMIVGIDVNHDWKRNVSTCGFVASRTLDFTRYNSYMSLQPRGQEIIEDAERLFFQSFKDYHKKNNCYPKRVIVFRDGVSTSQLQTVVEDEIKKGCKAAVARLKIDKPKSTRGWAPKVTAIVVQKRVTARFLKADGLVSVPPGTVVDRNIVSPRFWDFYLTTCEAPIGGTAASTRYIVVLNENKMTQNDIQALSHQMCSIYYNWPGPVRVPAPCMYASKVAYIFGTCVFEREPHVSLFNLPYYL